ncbi:MAG: hypothetical protein ACYDH5_05270 [Acidimicrobiales bacterium]
MSEDLQVLSESEQAETIASEWDDLAVERSRPFMAPGLLLAWYRHERPAGARPLVIVARAGGRIVGVAPFFVAPSRLGILYCHRLGAGVVPTSLRRLARRSLDGRRPIR